MEYSFGQVDIFCFVVIVTFLVIKRFYFLIQIQIFFMRVNIKEISQKIPFETVVGFVQLYYQQIKGNKYYSLVFFAFLTLIILKSLSKIIGNYFRKGHKYEYNRLNKPMPLALQKQLQQARDKLIELNAESVEQTLEKGIVQKETGEFSDIITEIDQLYQKQLLFQKEIVQSHQAIWREISNIKTYLLKQEEAISLSLSRSHNEEEKKQQLAGIDSITSIEHFTFADEKQNSEDLPEVTPEVIQDVTPSRKMSIAKVPPPIRNRNQMSKRKKNKHISFPFSPNARSKL